MARGSEARSQNTSHSVGTPIHARVGLFSGGDTSSRLEFNCTSSMLFIGAIQSPKGNLPWELSCTTQRRWLRRLKIVEDRRRLEKHESIFLKGRYATRGVERQVRLFTMSPGHPCRRRRALAVSASRRKLGAPGVNKSTADQPLTELPLARARVDASGATGRRIFLFRFFDRGSSYRVVGAGGRQRRSRCLTEPFTKPLFTRARARQRGRRCRAADISF